MEDADPAGIYGGCGFKSINAPAGRFTANQPYPFLFNKMIKTAHGIGTAAHTGNDRIGKLSFLFHDLLPDFFGDDRLEITDNNGKRMGAHY